MSTFTWLVSGRDGIQTQAIWWQSTPSSPLPHALDSPSSRAMVQMKEKVMKQWVKQRAWGHLKTKDARPSILCHLSPQGREGRSSRSWALPHRSHLCADLTVLQGDAAGRLLQPNPAASPTSRGSCVAGERPSPTHTWLPGVVMLACALCRLKTPVH